jgi:hypothetical protein
VVIFHISTDDGVSDLADRSRRLYQYRYSINICLRKKKSPTPHYSKEPVRMVERSVKEEVNTMREFLRETHATVETVEKSSKRTHLVQSPKLQEPAQLPKTTAPHIKRLTRALC